MSNARHQQTDGGAETVVKSEKETLTKLVNHHQDDWTSLLQGIQFAFNNSVNATTGFSPFYLAFGIHTITFPCFTEAKPSLASNFNQYERDLEEAHKKIFHAQDLMIKDYDRRHRSPPKFEVGSLVLLSREGIRWAPEQRTSVKLLQQFIGPFEILEMDTSRLNVTLKLPPTMKCHSTFHASKIQPWFRADEYSLIERSPPIHYQKLMRMEKSSMRSRYLIQESTVDGKSDSFWFGGKVMIALMIHGNQSKN